MRLMNGLTERVAAEAVSRTMGVLPPFHRIDCVISFATGLESSMPARVLTLHEQTLFDFEGEQITQITGRER